MRTCRAFGPRGRLWVAWLVLLLPLISACSPQDSTGPKDVALLIIRGPAGQPVRAYTLQIQERTTRQIVYRSGVQQVDPSGGTARDLSSAPLRLGLMMEGRGTYLFHLRAFPSLPTADGPRQAELFFATVVQVSGTLEVEAPLLPMPPGLDQDADGFPDGPLFLASNPEGAARYRDLPEVLDCVDRDPGPGQPPLPAGLRAADIHPLAQERCGLILDPTCSGKAQACLDQDGDGDPFGSDCDDRDPRRYRGNPRPRNCCACTDRASCARDHSKLPAAVCTPPRCDSDFDYDCTGQAVDCFPDDDCDGYSPNDPVASQRDCDDQDARVYPGAPKNCNDPSKDWACDGNPKGGCVDCDLDGDGYQRKDPPGPGAHCPGPDDQRPGQVDCDDEDRGVFPGSTSHEGATLLVRDLNGREGTSVAAALRGLCRNTTVSGAPQDADCDGKPAQGCPTRACDADGDGFPNSGAGCNPGMLPIDCNDADPTFFPGAPDRCGDGKAQNCSTDLPCTSDTDKDGYNAAVDCDNNDAKVFPFAPEVCNGKDDDCDGLIDELNPDAAGTRMTETRTVPDGNGTKSVTSVRSCTDSNVGECGRTVAATGGFTGHCVCTGVLPTTKPNLTDRTVCPAPIAANAAIAPRCFFAAQPEPQTCDSQNPRDEDCDGRTDAPEGTNLKEYGDSCGVDTGECQSGKVVGCDRKRNNPFSTFAGRNVQPPFPTSKRYLVCDDKTIPPRDELCNGLDDDCDGALPGSASPTPLASGDEADHDGDKYMACTTCGMTVAPGLLGCKDCKDDDRVIHPGAPELCDGKDNACAGSGAREGADDCKVGGATTCCSGPPLCVNTMENFAHCGMCGRPCPALGTDRCSGGMCRCGATDPCAAPTPVCKGAACVQCDTDAQCAAPKPRCGAASACVECLANLDCAAPGKPKCNPANTCVECLDNTHCAAPGKPKCSPANACVTCVGDGDCMAPTGKCKGMAACVQCLMDGDCMAPTGKCAPDNTCQECLSSDDCKTDPKRTCDTAAKTCVECLMSDDCKTDPRRTCDTAAKTCVECLMNTDCKTDPRRTCDTAAKTCVECTMDTDCKTDPKRKCGGGNVCVECVVNDDCKTDPKRLCGPTNACVECLMDMDCKTDPKRKCSPARACVQCLNNMDCPMGMTCDMGTCV